MEYDPRERRYLDPQPVSDGALRSRMVEDSRRLARALGYDVNTIEWAVRDGVPYAIDLMNPAPDLDAGSMPEEYFRWSVRKLADLAIAVAGAGP